MFQPYITGIVQALVGILVLFVLGGASLLGGRVSKWLGARTTAAQREILHRLAAEAAALAESLYNEAGGPTKLNAAITYVLDRAKQLGIDVSRESIRAAIEKAVQDYNARAKGASTNG
ncbi:phage holin, LLH family [Cohnella nanjingensis]|uniref:Phage holin n=1 Tax=Cohnella nanjingensis TaxID=1387779 RepID=A0A7X0RMU6_9BACL|nr:phage holin, LLH family [Cohnella nanjingensis]MBB6670296.1 hypothetical protein [Cohnella nanjingensis]